MGRKSFLADKRAFENEYRRYERQYARIHETYGNNMAAKLNRREYRAEILDEFKTSGRRRSSKSIAGSQILTTYSEAKAAKTNFYARLDSIKSKKPENRTATEQDLLNRFTITEGKHKGEFKKVSIQAYRAQSQRVYDKETKEWKEQKDLITQVYDEYKNSPNKEFIDEMFKSL